MRYHVANQIRFALIRSLAGIVLLFPIAIVEQARASEPVSQAADITQSVSTPNTPANPGTDMVISPDDVLDVYVMDVAELSRQYRVSPTGKVVLPLLPGPVDAAGLTLSEFSNALSKQLHDNGIVVTPHIVVTIFTSRVKSVSITGAVKMPQIYPVLARTTLLDVLSQAQGLSDDASNIAVISRGDIGTQATNSTDRVETVNLKKLLESGDPTYNIAIYPGDRVTVPHAGVVYVVGAVHKPGGFVIRAPDNGVTVIQAIAMAEDAKSTAVRNKAMIIRADSSQPNGHRRVPLDLDLILAGKQPDVLLLADDILFVPDSAAKRAFQRSMEAAVQVATGLAIYGRY